MRRILTPNCQESVRAIAVVEKIAKTTWMPELRKVGVIGAGTMGNGIAQVFAQSGFDVRLVDSSSGALDRARATIEKSLGKLVEKSKLSAVDRDGALARLLPGVNRLLLQPGLGIVVC